VRFDRRIGAGPGLSEDLLRQRGVQYPQGCLSVRAFPVDQLQQTVQKQRQTALP